MSVQFGRWNDDGRPVEQDHVEKVKALLVPYGPDHCSSYCEGDVGILYHAFHTTKESRRETQPHVTASGAVITWDGRLDNRADLIRELRDVLTINSTDASIVAAAYEKWGAACFSRLIGDWALAIWNPRDRSLVLAKDTIGTRHLYYSLEQGRINWSSVLDPLVLLAGKTFALEEECIAGWLSFFPGTHLTPYVGIHSVPPSSFVLIRSGRQTVNKYWDFDPSNRIRYRSDAEYEEHFRTVFEESVRRRLRSDSPILAELSGGMDSSSIVCIADIIIARGEAETPKLDTLSYYNDSEPHWNERPYFRKVEEKRGRPGYHIDVGSQTTLPFDLEGLDFTATPASQGRPSKAAAEFGACLESQKNRVLLSGIGGDEVLGGVPAPQPELGDLLTRAQLFALAGRLKQWALAKRKPWFYLLFDTLGQFLPPALTRTRTSKLSLDWLSPALLRRQRTALSGYHRRITLSRRLPSYQANLATLEALRRQLSCSPLRAEPPYEMRYPYLDRDLLEFVYAIPRDQLVRPGQRRSLMRRALAGVVPDEILSRRRKAFVTRRSLALIASESSRLMDLSQHLVTSAVGIVEGRSFGRVIEKARDGQQIQIVGLLRTLMLEGWLAAARSRCVLTLERIDHAQRNKQSIVRVGAAREPRPPGGTLGLASRTEKQGLLSQLRKNTEGK